VFTILRRRFLCAMGKHELVSCEDIPIVGFHCYRCLHCGFLQLAAERSRALKGVVLAIVSAAIFAALLLLASQYVTCCALVRL
jgi:hypothetical protein